LKHTHRLNAHPFPTDSLHRPKQQLQLLHSDAVTGKHSQHLNQKICNTTELHYLQQVSNQTFGKSVLEPPMGTEIKLHAQPILYRLNMSQSRLSLSSGYRRNIEDS
jgi:hypothetical protein